MSNYFLKKGAMLIVLSLLTFSPWTLVSGEEVKMQGLIMNIDLKQHTMVVNEKTFTWLPNTAIHNDQGSPIPMDRFKQNAWVYVEGEKDENNRIHIKKIYLLPKRVDKKEMHLYPFME